MEIKGKKVLVTGAGGFIGSHLVGRLCEMGAEVRALVHYNSRNDWGMLEHLPKDVLGGVEVVAGDMKDAFSVRSAVRGREVVFHLASLIAIPYSYVAPMSYVDTNVTGALNVMQACLDEGVSKVVHTSTSEVYGSALYEPIDEEHPLQGQSPYSASKIGADKIAESYNLSFDLPVATIRPFNTYGPRQSARAVIPTIISQALALGSVKLGDLTPVRDLTFVKDTAQGFIDIAASDSTVGVVTNIGNGFGVTIGELAKMIFSIMGKSIEIETDAQRVRPAKSEVRKLICDNTKARHRTGWAPRHSLEDGLRQTIDWVATHPDLYKVNIYNV